MDPEKHFMGRHNLIQTHEASERTNLYVAHHAHHIEGLDPEESEKTIRYLLEHASKPEYTFKVDWENNGDIIIWVCTSHSRNYVT